jgi:basic membrane protein A
MKKILALVLALCMVFALCACGTKTTTTTATDASTATNTDKTTVSADDIADTMTSTDGKYEIAFVTDIGQLKDKSFNEGTWNGVKLYAYQNSLSYKYYQPANGANATDDDRFNAMQAAVDGGAKVVVCAGFLQGTALAKAAAANTSTNFVFIDGWSLKDDAGNVLPNVAGIAFKEEQAGYFAGYAVVMEGYDKLGFCGGGGGTNPACCRYGYGYLQGANDAAKAMNKTVECNYSWQYGSSYQASPELQTMANGWYGNGTQVIFACGGSMFESIAAAASSNDGYVVGVDTDQSSQSDTVITSAMKGIGQAAQYAIGKSYDGSWADIGGKDTSLGVSDDAIGLPTDTWSLKNYTVDQYNELLGKVKDGSVTISPDYPEDMSTATFSNVTVHVI